MLADYLKMALKNMKKRRLRAFLTLIGITISITTIFVLISLSLGLEQTVQEQFETLGVDKFFIQPRGSFGPPGAATAATLTTRDVEEIKKISGVRETSSWIAGNAKVEFRDEIRFFSVLGYEPETEEVAFGSYKLEEGRFLRESDVRKIMIGSQYKHNNIFGRQVTLGDSLLINDVEFKVTGIFEQTGSPPDDRQIYVTENDFRELFNVSERVDFIVVQVSDPSEVNSVAERTEKELMKFRDVDEDTRDFSISTPEEFLESFQNILNIITFFLFGIAGISLLVGGINIANSMFTSVLERTREIGVMKAIGAQNKDILTIFLIESGLLGLIGGIAGVLLGIGIGKVTEFIAVSQLGTTLLKVAIPPYLIFGSLAFAFFAGAFSGLWPAWKAMKVRPVEALRYE